MRLYYKRKERKTKIFYFSFLCPPQSSAPLQSLFLSRRRREHCTLPANKDNYFSWGWAGCCTVVSLVSVRLVWLIITIVSWRESSDDLSSEWYQQQYHDQPPQSPTTTNINILFWPLFILTVIKNEFLNATEDDFLEQD